MSSPSMEMYVSLPCTNTIVGPLPLSRNGYAEHGDHVRDAHEGRHIELCITHVRLPEPRVDARLEYRFHARGAGAGHERGHVGELRGVHPQGQHDRDIERVG